MNTQERHQLIAENFKETIQHLKEVYPEAPVNEKCGFYNGPGYDIKGDDVKMIDELNKAVSVNVALYRWDNLNDSILNLQYESRMLSENFNDALICFKKALREETPVLEEKCFNLTGLKLKTYNK